MPDPATERRLRALEAGLEALSRRRGRQSEALSPNYLTIDPVTHLVGANFTGLVNALGLIIPSYLAPSGNIPITNSVVWESTANGAVLAQIGNIEQVASDYSTLFVAAFARDAAGNSQVIISAADDQQAAWSKLILTQTARGTSSSILFAAPPAVGQDTLIAGDGTSRFVQSAPGTTVAHTGDPMTVYLPSASAAVGTGVDFNYIAGVGVTPSVGTDPGSRWNGTGYVCRRTGIYEASGGISYPASSVNQVQVGASNNTSGYKIKALALSPTAVAGAGHSFGGIMIPANAGDVIIPVAQFSAALSVGTLAGSSPATYFSCKQVQ